MPEFQTIEQKYGIQPGEDWLEVRAAAYYQPGQRVNFGHYPATVTDIRRITRFGVSRYEYRIQIDPGGKWGWKGDRLRWAQELNIRAAGRDQLNGLGASDLAATPESVPVSDSQMREELKLAREMGDEAGVEHLREKLAQSRRRQAESQYKMATSTAPESVPLSVNGEGPGVGSSSYEPPADFDPVATATGAINTAALDDEYDGEVMLYDEVNRLKMQLEKLAQELAHQMEVAEKRSMEVARLEKELKRQQRRNTVPSPNELTAAHARIKELEAQIAGRGRAETSRQAAQPATLTLVQKADLNKPEAIRKLDAEIDDHRAEYDIHDIGWNITTKQIIRAVVLVRKVERARIIHDTRDPIPRAANGRADREAANQRIRDIGEEVAAHYDRNPQPIGLIAGTLLNNQENAS